MTLIKVLKLSGLLLLLVLLLGTGWLFLKVERRPADAPLVSAPMPGAPIGMDGGAVAWMAELYRDSGVPSMTAAVGLKGQLLWAGAIGHADLSGAVPATPETRYRIGSISKPITAITAMRLYERGAIDINAPFATYVPDFPFAPAGYSLKQLLSHQAGIRHYGGMAETWSDTPYSTTRDAAAIFAADPLLFPPGTGFTYSSHGYTLVALALEKATGQGFETLVQGEVLGPTGMARTGLDHKGATAAKDARGYMRVGGLLFPVFADDLSNRYAGGGFRSTAIDLAALGNALTAGALLQPATRDLLWTPVPLADGSMNPERYAMGFRAGEDELGRFVHHGGTANGGSAMLLIYPDLGLTIAICTNDSAGDAAFDRLAAARRLARLFASK